VALDKRAKGLDVDLDRLTARVPRPTVTEKTEELYQSIRLSTGTIPEPPPFTPEVREKLRQSRQGKGRKK
jgi:hypothetical protein